MKASPIYSVSINDSRRPFLPKPESSRYCGRVWKHLTLLPVPLALIGVGSLFSLIAWSIDKECNLNTSICPEDLMDVGCGISTAGVLGTIAIALSETPCFSKCYQKYQMRNGQG